MASSGHPYWSGSRDVAEAVAYLGPRHGAFISSRKRPPWHILSRRNPSSDHNEANRTAYAIDFATFRGANLAHALARALGVRGYRTGTYTNYVISVGGARFKVQILWAVSGHFDHVHLGVRLISGVFRPRPKPRDPDDYTIRKGSRPSQAIQTMQVLLRRAGFLPRRWSAHTKYTLYVRRAVRRFQKAKGLHVDGVVGKSTWSALRRAAK